MSLRRSRFDSDGLAGSGRYFCTPRLRGAVRIVSTGFEVGGDAVLGAPPRARPAVADGSLDKTAQNVRLPKINLGVFHSPATRRPTRGFIYFSTLQLWKTLGVSRFDKLRKRVLLTISNKHTWPRFQTPGKRKLIGETL